MWYLVSDLWFFLFIALVAGVITGWMTCRKRV